MIECRGVSFSYDGAVPALDGVDLNIEDGEFFCILGGNGSGKSTFAKHLNALLQPDAGTVCVNGMDASDPELVYDIRSTAGMVFQNPDDQLVATLVEDDVAFGPENLGVESAQIAQRVREALKAVGLVGFERHETHALSGGQKQRVALDGVLAMEPRVLILDEASSMLDPRGHKGLMKACHALHDRGMTIVMITHFMEEASEADRVAVFRAGRVAMLGTPEEILMRADELAQLNLDMPASCCLGMELRAKGVPVHAQVREVDMVAEIAQTYAERSGAGTVGQSSAPQSEIVGGTVSASNEDDVPEPVIELSHVSYSYSLSARERRRWRKRSAVADKSNKQALWGNDPSSPWALRDVSLTVRRGEFLGLAGHTGSGKSTLVQHLNGLIRPQEGSVRALGLDLSNKKDAAAVKAKVGVVFQYPERQLFAETVAQDVAFGPHNLGLPQDEVDRRVESSLSRVGLDLSTVGDKSPFELSGGQQRRVAFAGVLAMEPEVLVLDEPMAGLDPAARRDFLELIDRLHRNGLTVVMVSHSMDDLANCCDRIVVMNEGAVFAEGTPEQVFAHADELKSIGLGVPAAQRMALALAEAGVPLRRGGLYTVESLADELADLLIGRSDGSSNVSDKAKSETVTREEGC
ncbi:MULTISPECIES: energy-coupling factor transporter ATPase [unclassified Collinsella]|uniref:energy-coupling factor transporter ATPase n=1 Tax=unclassified Collinsella TaxID=2637548 RepID=UPI000E4BACBC|nr:MULTISPECIES: energy-coupling factor transporter ATPase [unclassified Collinsella]RHJ40764.1 energy-coupling factor transporter ATPase [Collinsella sp. AM10-48]RHJ41748.1 energy-coupling factor transporter ATPase [Collinsella sp. AM10-32]RHJ46484.1 energy-coupling factor transporter ATPase [Collinsella sp. AM10-27]RHJ46952.1 energy-coupling factor transporter ATPase [Collinsella sp. AM10-26]RHJ55987.1 energy-coupling factor transporter ATPase [Collinsella sp. AM10-11]